MSSSKKTTKSNTGSKAKQGMDNRKVKVSIVVPCCNVEKFLEECLDSIVRQTLKDIEIICVNDGSKDGTLSIIRKYEKKDSRIKVLDKPNSGYGDSMNKGFAMATGEYIGIVESDDFIEPEMFEKLYAAAVKYDVDVVKSNFWFYWGETKVNELHEYFKEEECGYVIQPREFDGGSLYGRKPSIWSAIYKRDFLTKKNISFLDTPGASFQDTSFTFKVYSSAERMVCLYDAFLHYRQDNANSSVNNADKKIEFVFKEYKEIESYISKGAYTSKLYPIYAAAFYDTCIWTYERLSIGKRFPFLKTISPWFKELIDKVGIDNIAFGECWWKRRDIERIALDPMEYQTWRNVERYEQNHDSLVYKTPHTPVNNIRKVKKLEGDKAPRFSLIVPIYNVEKYLASCLDSIINQTYEDIEIIGVCDGTKDHSLSILEEYAEVDSRIRIINQENQGLAAARNSGLKVATGEYILFIDSDDYISEKTCEILDKRIKENKESFEAILFGTNIFPNIPKADEWYYQTLETEDVYIENVDSNTLSQNRNLSVFVWRYCFKKAFLDEHKIAFDSSVRYGEDAVFLFEHLPKVNRIMSISDKLYYYRHYRENSLMNEAKRDSSVYAKHQLEILETIIKAVKKNDGTFSGEFYMYASDFVYGSIEGCEDVQKIKFRSLYASLIKKYNLDNYVSDCPQNYQDYWNECVNSKKAYKEMSKYKKNGFRGVVTRVLPPSRQAFYDYYSKLIEMSSMQQSALNNMQQQLYDMQRQIINQKEAINEARWLSGELIKKYDDDKLWKLQELLDKGDMKKKK